MCGKEILEYLDNFIDDYGNADVILSDKRGEYHYTGFDVADLIYALRTINTERMNIVSNICNREIERQECLMRCAEHSGNHSDWMKYCELQGVYMTIRDILTGQLKEDF